METQQPIQLPGGPRPLRAGCPGLSARKGRSQTTALPASAGFKVGTCMFKSVMPPTFIQVDTPNLSGTEKSLVGVTGKQEPAGHARESKGNKET